MNQQQKAARDEAVDELLGIWGPEYRLSAQRFVDALIVAATPGRSEHADAVAGMLPVGTPDPRD